MHGVGFLERARGGGGKPAAAHVQHGALRKRREHFVRRLRREHGAVRPLRAESAKPRVYRRELRVRKPRFVEVQVARGRIF